MKYYIKNGKIEKTPIKIETEKEVEENGIKKQIKNYKFTTDEKTILEAGYEIYIPAQVSVEKLVEASNSFINKQTDQKILNDFIYNNNEFYLSMENQFNFKNLYDLRNQRKYPVTVKTKTGFMELKTPEEVESFYLAGVIFIENCLTEGWKLKAEAEKKIRTDAEKKEKLQAEEK